MNALHTFLSAYLETRSTTALPHDDVTAGYLAGREEGHGKGKRRRGGNPKTGAKRNYLFVL